MTFVAGYNPQLAWQDSPLIVVIGERILLSGDAVFSFSCWSDIALLGAEVISAHHLGDWHHQPLALVELHLPEHMAAKLPTANLRQLLDLVSAAEFDLLGRALQLVHWRKTHQYCGQCGQPTEASTDELCRRCQHCTMHYYPRISPCVIGLVNRGRELLLAHHVRHRDPRYSLLAGFIEAGESAEQALTREIREETGLSIANATYITSQPWPFPGQLMLGFVAEYAAGEIQIDPREIRDARWFDIDQLPLIPPPQTIAGKLIELRVAQLRAIYSR